jgi:peroxiredoxin family protein
MGPQSRQIDRPRVAIFVHGGEYDRVHEALSIAAAAVSCEKHADVFLFWWALERFAQGRLDEPDFAGGREDVVDRFEDRRVPTLRSLWTYLRESGECTVYACTGSMQILGIKREALEPWVDQFIGWSTIFQLTAGVADRFSL